MSSTPTNPYETSVDSLPKGPAGTSLNGGSVGFLTLCCLVASLGGLLFGFDTAVIAGTIEMVETQFKLNTWGEGWEGWGTGIFTSSALVGCIIGAAVAGWLGDKFGRKPILLLSAVLFFISALFSAIPPTFEILIPARIIGGIGVGMASVLAPMYISEFAPAQWRGRLVAFYQLSIVCGILLAYCSNLALDQIAKHHADWFATGGILHWTIIAEGWRAMFGAEMLPAGLFFLLLLIVPESPRWLAGAGREKQAMAILTRLSGQERATASMNEIRTALAGEEGTFAELLRPGLRTALLVGVGLSFFGQLTGVNIIIYYGQRIFSHAGFETSAFLYQVIVGVVNLIFTAIALAVIDRLGRRPLLLIGMTIVTIAATIIGVLFFLGDSTIVIDSATGEKSINLSNPWVGAWIAALVLVYIAAIALSICAVIWVLTPEIFPNRVRGRAASVCTFTNWGTNTIAIFAFPPLVAALGMHMGFFTFAAFCLVGTIFFWKFVPETKGKSLEEIEKIWHRDEATPPTQP